MDSETGGEGHWIEHSSKSENSIGIIPKCCWFCHPAKDSKQVKRVIKVAQDQSIDDI